MTYKQYIKALLQTKLFSIKKQNERWTILKLNSQKDIILTICRTSKYYFIVKWVIRYKTLSKIICRKSSIEDVINYLPAKEKKDIIYHLDLFN